MEEVVVPPVAPVVDIYAAYKNRDGSISRRKVRLSLGSRSKSRKLSTKVNTKVRMKEGKVKRRLPRARTVLAKKLEDIRLGRAKE